MTNQYSQEITVDMIEAIRAANAALRANPPKHRFTNGEIVQMIFGGVNVEDAGCGIGGRNKDCK